MGKIVRTIEVESISLDDAFEEFIEEKEAFNKSKDTIRNYKLSYSIYCRTNGYDRKTSTEDVKQQSVYRMAGALKLDGVKPNSINHYIRDIRVFLYWCMDEQRSYMEPFKVKQTEAQEEELKFFTKEECVALTERPKKPTSDNDFTEWRTWTIVCWVLATGNRASSIVNLKMGDIDLINKKAKLRQTKNNKFQTINLSSELVKIVKEYVRYWRRDSEEDEWLFPNRMGEQLTTTALRTSFGRYCKSRGVNKSNIHGLRHTFARNWAATNGNAYALQHILGHSSLEMSRKYVRMFGEDYSEQYDKYSILDNIRKEKKRAQAIKRSVD